MRCALALALVLFVVGCGASEQDGIRRAIRSSAELSAVRARRLTIDVSDIRIAPSNPRFATALVNAHDRNGRQAVDTALAYLHRTDRWRVVDLGTATVYASCGQTPRAVVMELFGGWCYGARGALRRLS